jgi:hypothetical protein
VQQARNFELQDLKFSRRWIWWILDCDAVWLLEKPTFRMKVSPPSSGWKESESGYVSSNYPETIFFIFRVSCYILHGSWNENNWWHINSRPIGDNAVALENPVSMRCSMEHIANKLNGQHSAGEWCLRFGKSKVIFSVTFCHRGQLRRSGWGGGGWLVYGAPRADQAAVSRRNPQEEQAPNLPLLGEWCWQLCPGLLHHEKKRYFRMSSHL